VLPYWLLFLVPAWLAITRLRPVQTQTKRWPVFWWVAFVSLVLMIGLRHEVGGDWSVYAEQIRDAAGDSLEQAVTLGDPAYHLLNWLAVRMDLGPYFVNTACAVLFAWGLVVFCRAQPRPWLALAVAVPYLVTVVAMGYTRQGVAIGLVMLGLVALSDRKILRFVAFVALAAMFHRSAVILMPLAVLADSRHRVWTALWVGLSSLLLYVLLVQESVENLTANYLEAEYASSGAAIRVAMNAVPAVLFLLFRRRFVMPQADRTFWTWMSLGALAFVGLLAVSPSSTAVDRVALYWIPLQLFVLSRLPNALGKRDGRNPLWVCTVVGYSAAVLFVWLFFGSHAEAWLPYQFYPWVWLWA
jgi:EpsG-like putative glucosyltransferase